ncbi:hypothetical protein ACJVQT_23055 [Enterobacter huaxiensis]|uniref:hypothetical protein n=1 Tax=Enterobacter huaxiensis TaxID=2494702 RepID=UPI002175F0EA|nr:hypothetical protein [Enterobacter huaxiensis]MCS5452546.1 hypothetical protein [Enterobacter huaxiensis]
MNINILNTNDIVIPEHPALFNKAGVLQPMPAAFWQYTTRDQRMLFGHKHAIYAIPTNESIELIKTLIAGREESAIEIGAGNGAFGLALNIHSTDSKQQLEPKYRAVYESMRQPIIAYGEHVTKLDAAAAIKKLRPRIVFAAWVTHKYNPLKHELAGNEAGVDEIALVNAVDEYIFFGNTKNHSQKPLLPYLEQNAHLFETNIYHNTRVDPAYLFSRASGGQDFILHVKKAVL